MTWKVLAEIGELKDCKDSVKKVRLVEIRPGVIGLDIRKHVINPATGRYEQFTGNGVLMILHKSDDISDLIGLLTIAKEVYLKL